MSILIKGMEKPISCDDCIVPLSKCDYLQRRADTCPLIEIVTCGECKHSKEWYRDRLMCHLWAEFGVSVFEDGFCNYGERRKED